MNTGDKKTGGAVPIGGILSGGAQALPAGGRTGDAAGVAGLGPRGRRGHRAQRAAGGLQGVDSAGSRHQFHLASPFALSQERAGRSAEQPFGPGGCERHQIQSRVLLNGRGHPGFVLQRPPPAQAAPQRVPLFDRRRHPGKLRAARSPARRWWTWDRLRHHPPDSGVPPSRHSDMGGRSCRRPWPPLRRRTCATTT